MIELLQQRLDGYRIANPVEEEQATKEILQEIALYALWRAGFFDVAAFRGGTSLRILHQLPRFSEDLDFILKTPDPDFDWGRYLKPLVAGLQQFGLRPEVVDRSRLDQNVRKSVLKKDSICNQLNLSFYDGHAGKSLTIKLEIDINPPAGAQFDYSYVDFPLDYEVCHQDLGSNFALTIHALLCRPCLLGRDWYDFNWYVKQRVSPNLPHLHQALRQCGSWAGEDFTFDGARVRDALLEEIAAIDWSGAAREVERFLGAAETESLTLWSERFFRGKVEQLGLSEAAGDDTPS